VGVVVLCDRYVYLGQQLELRIYYDFPVHALVDCSLVDDPSDGQKGHVQHHATLSDLHLAVRGRGGLVPVQSLGIPLHVDRAGRHEGRRQLGRIAAGSARHLLHPAQQHIGAEVGCKPQHQVGRQNHIRGETAYFGAQGEAAGDPQ